jgi:hypothetical protein
VIPACGGLADLTRTAHQRHLPVLAQVLFKERIIDSSFDLHT